MGILEQITALKVACVFMRKNLSRSIYFGLTPSALPSKTETTKMEKKKKILHSNGSLERSVP